MLAQATIEAFITSHDCLSHAAIKKAATFHKQSNFRFHYDTQYKPVGDMVRSHAGVKISISTPKGTWGIYIYTHHIGEHCIKISSNSDNNYRRRIILKNHDVTITMSSGHVTSSGACPIDSPWALSHKLSIGTIPLSGLIS